jgi:hypothetical protein
MGIPTFLLCKQAILQRLGCFLFIRHLLVLCSHCKMVKTWVEVTMAEVLKDVHTPGLMW